ncbi:MAG TPA: 30S ribosomal protein S8, partial [Rhabdochlamydiaceae bacterium]|nr:30S ribosomal protein S8 [Rhabdochlamydiaceae bacterium]
LHDPVSDLLTRIRNAKAQRHKYVDFIYSKLRFDIVKVLQAQGFLENVLVDDQNDRLRVFLKYGKDRKPVINGLKRISSPGLRKYVGYQNIPVIFGGMGVAVLSTSKGVVDGSTARSQKVGGELICLVW